MHSCSCFSMVLGAGRCCYKLIMLLHRYVYRCILSIADTVYHFNKRLLQLKGVLLHDKRHPLPDN